MMLQLNRPSILNSSKLAFLLSFALCDVATAAELIKTPEGVMVRSLFDWENAESLDVSEGGSGLNAPNTEYGAEYLFSPSSLCQQASYRLRKISGRVQTVNLSHLCNSRSTTSVTFALIADTQELHNQHERTAQLLADLLQRYPQTEFVINAGDIVDKGTDEQWQAYRAIAEKFYTYRLPIVPVLGNHEYFEDETANGFAKVYATESTKQGYYFIDVGPARLIVLNSNIDRMNEDEQKAQTAWLKETLASSQFAGKSVVVTYHHPAFATGIANIFMPAPPRYIKKHWLPLFKQFSVKLVLNGHEHVYDRLTIDNIRFLNAGPAGGTIGRTKPLKTPHSDLVLKDLRTVTIISIQKSQGKSTFDIKTYSPDREGQLVDELKFN